MPDALFRSTSMPVASFIASWPTTATRGQFLAQVRRELIDPGLLAPRFRQNTAELDHVGASWRLTPTVCVSAAATASRPSQWMPTASDQRQLRRSCPVRTFQRGPWVRDDIAYAITPGTRIVLVVNGVRHLWLLTAAFGQELVFAAQAKLTTPMLSDNTIEEVAPGIQVEIGQLDGGRSQALSHTVAELDVQNIAVINPLNAP